MGKWLEMVAGKKGKDESFERWIQDGTVLAKVKFGNHGNHGNDDYGDGCRQEMQR